MPLISTKAGDSAQGYGFLAAAAKYNFISNFYTTAQLRPAAIAIDSSNNIYITNDDGGSQVFTDKFSSTGLTIWQKGLNSAANEYGGGITVDSSGNIIIAGSVNISSNYRHYVAKYDSSGTLQWQRYIGSSSAGNPNLSRCVTTDSSGNIFIGGQSSNGTNWIGVILKYNSSGTLQWQKTNDAGGGADTTLWGITTDSAGNCYLVGNSNGVFYVAKYNTSGTLQWQRYPNNLGYGYGVGKDSTDNIYIAGAIYSAGVPDCYIAKYNSSGTLQWQKKLSTANDDLYQAVAVDSSGNSYAAGYSYNGTRNEIVIAKRDSSGTLQWQRKISTSVALNAVGIVLDSTTNYVVSAKLVGSPYDQYLTLKFPTDGSLTGTYVVNTYSITYAASSLTDASGGGTSGTPTNTTSTPAWTDTAASLTDGSTSFTNALLNF